MKLDFNLPEFSQIDQKITEIKNLANNEPLVSIIEERFQQQITHHLTSLQSTSKRATEAAANNLLKDRYLLLGKEHAVSMLVFDLAKQLITASSIQLLAEILFNETSFRTKDLFIVNINGNKQNTPKANKVLEETEKLITEYHQLNKDKSIHPIIKATYLHYKITAIHPFNDWNGRIARLLLNISLMNNHLLPILIAPSDRLTYYESLEKADNDKLFYLIQFIAKKELETIEEFMGSAEYLSIKGKIDLQKQLENVNGKEKCFLLTEDSTTQNLMQLLIESSGFKINETNIISYEGCSKIASANLFSIFVKEKMPHVKILVHRDRDYLTDEEIEIQQLSFRRIDTHLFVTKGTDVESHFLNAKHINFCYPQISIEMAEKFIQKAIDGVFSKSVDYLRKKEFGPHKTEAHTHLNKALENLIIEQPLRFTHGKTTLRIVELKLNDYLGKRVNLFKPSPFLKIDELENFAKTIWH